MNTATLNKLAAVAFNELESVLLGNVSPRQVNTGVAAGTKSALFVTWTKKGTLRGCIGTFAPLPVVEGVKQYALIAALKDPRFKPISASELPKLEVSVTILGPLEPIDDPMDWQIGLHGVKAEFPGHKSATFLPEIAEEQGWTKQDTLEALADKAGASSLTGLSMSRYLGTKVKMSYAQYKESE